ncbi:MAG: signal recognition particle-docking protein FtsY [bacterium]
MEPYLARIRDWLDEATQALWAYVQGLTPDQVELYFLGLFAAGCLLSIWLLYSIHRRSQGVGSRGVRVSSDRHVDLPTFVEPGTSPTGDTSAANVSGPPIDVSEEPRRPPRQKRSAKGGFRLDTPVFPARRLKVSKAPPPEEVTPPPPPKAARGEQAPVGAPARAPAAQVTPRPPTRAPAPAVTPRPPTRVPAPVEAKAPPAAVPAPPPTRESLFARLRAGLAATRDGLVRGLDALVSGRGAVDERVVGGVEELLIASDVGVRTTAVLLESVRSGIRSGKIRSADDLKAALKERIFEILSIPVPNPTVEVKPRVLLVVGVNGTGKTTSIGKLAARFKSEGETVMLAAADTFRAAAIEQLEIWGQRCDVPVIRQGEGADPGAVAFDALKAAKARGIDRLIVDTAGRMHTKKNLMEEIRKVKRVLGRDHPGAPHEVFLVLDATTGQNAISQAHLFHEALELSGLVLTKLDGTAKGGVVIGICDELRLPVRYIGIGETIDDLRPFDARDFVDALFGDS